MELRIEEVRETISLPLFGEEQVLGHNIYASWGTDYDVSGNSHNWQYKMRIRKISAPQLKGNPYYDYPMHTYIITTWFTGGVQKRTGRKRTFPDWETTKEYLLGGNYDEILNEYEKKRVQRARERYEKENGD